MARVNLADLTLGVRDLVNNSRKAVDEVNKIGEALEKGLKPTIDKFEKQINTASKNSRIFGQELGVAEKTVETFSRKTEELFKSLQRINSGFRQTGQAVFAFAAVLSILAVPKIRQGLDSLVSITIEYQDSLIRTAKTAGLYITAQEEMEAGGTGLEKNLDTLDTKLRNLARVVAVPTEQLSAMAAVAGQAGADTVAEIENLTGAAAIFSTITGVAGEQAVESLATILAAFGKLNEEGIKDVDNLINTINRLENETVASAEEIVTTLLDASGSAAQLGVAEADLIGFAAFLKQTGLNADEAGTALRELFRVVTRESDSIATLLDISQEQLFARLDSPGGPIDVVLQIADALSKVDSNSKAAGIAAEIFDVRATKALTRVSNNTEEFVSILQTSREEWANGTSAIDEYSVSLKSLRAQWVILENRVKNVAIAFAKDLQPAAEQAIAFLIALTDELGKVISGINTRTKLMAVAFSAAFVVIVPLLTIFGSLIFAFGLFLNGITNLIAGLGFLGSGFGPVIIAAAALLFIFRDQIPSAIDSLVSNLLELSDIFSDLANDAIAWGTNLIAAFAEGIIRGINTYVIPAINAVIGIISDFLEGHSPPRKGPLSHIMDWGASVFSAFLRGFSLADFDLLSKVSGIIEKRIRDLIDLKNIGEDEGFNLLKNLRESIARGIETFRRTGQFPVDVFNQLEGTLGSVGKEINKLIKYQLQYNKLIEELDRLNKERRVVQNTFRREARAIENNTSLTAAQKAAALAALRARRNAELNNIDAQEEAKQQEKDRFETLIQFQEKLINALQEQDSVFVDIAKSIKDLTKSLSKARKKAEKSDRLDDLMEELAILQKLKKQYEAAGLDILPLLREEVRLRKRIVEEQISRGLDTSEQISAIKALEEQIAQLEEKSKKAKEDTIPRLGSSIEGLGGISEATADSTETLVQAIQALEKSGGGFFGLIDGMKAAVQAFFRGVQGKGLALLPEEKMDRATRSTLELQKRLFEIGKRIKEIIDTFRNGKNQITGFFEGAKSAAKSALGPIEAFRKGLRGEELDLLPAEKLAKMKNSTGIIKLYNTGLKLGSMLANDFTKEIGSLDDIVGKVKKKFSESKESILKAGIAMLVFLDAIAIFRTGGLSLLGILTGLAQRHGLLGSVLTSNSKLFSKLAARVASVYFRFIQIIRTSPNKVFKTLRGTVSGFISILNKLIGKLFRIGNAADLFAVFKKEFAGFVRLAGKGANVIPVDIGLDMVRGMNFRGMANFFAVSFGSNLIGVLSATLMSIGKLLPGRISGVFERLAFSIGAQGIVASLTSLFTRAFGKLALGEIVKKRIVSGILSGMAAIGITDLDRGIGKVLANLLNKILGASFIKGFTGIFGKITGLLTSLVGKLIISGLGPLISGFIALGSAIAGPLILIIGIIGTLAGVVLYLAENFDLVVQRVGEFIQNFLTAMGIGVETAEGFQVNFAKISDVLGRIKDGLVPVLALFAGLGKLLGALIINMLPGLGTVLGAIIMGILEGVALITSIVGGIIRIIGSIFEAFKTGDFSVIVDTWEEVAMSIGKALEGLFGAALTVIQGVFDMIVRGLVGLIAEIMNLLGFSPEQVDSFIEWGDNLIDTAIQIGKDVIGGLWEGIKSGARKLWSIIKGIAERVIKIANKIFDRSSPSGVFIEIGEDLIMGLIVGIQNMIDALVKILQDVFGDMINSLLQFGMRHAPNLTMAIVGFIWDAASWLRNTGIPLILRLMTIVPMLLIRGFYFFRDKVLPVLMEVFGWLSTKGVVLAKKIFNWISNVGIPILRNLAIAAIEAFDKGFGFLQEHVFPIIKKVFNWLTEIAIPKVKEVAESIKTFIGDAIEWLKTNWETIKTRILTVWDQISTKVKAVLDEWLPKFQELWQKISDIIGLILAIWYTGFMIIAELVKAAIQEFIDKMLELWQGTEDVRNKIRDILNTGINFIKEKLLGFFGDWIGKNTEIDEATAAIKDKIRDLWDKGVSYIKDSVEDFFDNFIGWLDDIIEGLKDALDLLRKFKSEKGGAGGGGGTAGFGGPQKPGGARGGLLFHRAGQNQGMLLRVAEKENEYLIPESELENFFSNYTGKLVVSGNEGDTRDIHLHMHNPIVRSEMDIKRLVKEIKRELMLEIKR